MKQRNLKPYIRRHHLGDKTGSFRTAIRLAFLEEVRGAGNFFVLVQHGRKGGHEVMECGMSKREIFSNLLAVFLSKVKPNGKEWCRKMQSKADKRTREKRMARRARLLKLRLGVPRETGRMKVVGVSDASGKPIAGPGYVTIFSDEIACSSKTILPGGKEALRANLAKREAGSE